MIKLRRRARNVLAAALFMIMFGVPTAANAAWDQIVDDTINDTFSSVEGTKITTDSEGIPYVAFTQGVIGRSAQLYVKYLVDLESTPRWVSVDGEFNRDGDADASSPSIANIAGTIYVAWAENDVSAGVPHRQIRVAIINPDWTVTRLADSDSPINYRGDGDASHPSLASVAGKLYVSWSEKDGSDSKQIHVARYLPDYDVFEQVGSGISPINHGKSSDAEQPSLTDGGGQPLVTWREEDGVNWEIRAARYDSTSKIWQKLDDGDSPINVSPSANAETPSVTTIKDVPYVAWSESGEKNSQVWVARFDGTLWKRIPGPSNPINRNATHDALDPTIVNIGQAPYVSFRESDGRTWQARVSRLGKLAATGIGWIPVVDSDAPINTLPINDAEILDLANARGAPFVVWYEPQYYGLYVKRLTPDLVRASANTGKTSATMSARFNTYGVAWPVWFRYHLRDDSVYRITPRVFTSRDTYATVKASASGLKRHSMYGFRISGQSGLSQPIFHKPEEELNFTTK